MPLAFFPCGPDRAREEEAVKARKNASDKGGELLNWKRVKGNVQRAKSVASHRFGLARATMVARSLALA